MIPETVPVWLIPLLWIVSGVVFFLLSSYHGKNRAVWTTLGFALPVAAIVAYPISYYRSRRERRTGGGIGR
jgi:hypothetical protein